MLFCGMGTPKQFCWLGRLHCGARAAMCTMDVIVKTFLQSKNAMVGAACVVICECKRTAVREVHLLYWLVLERDPTAVGVACRTPRGVGVFCKGCVQHEGQLPNCPRERGAGPGWPSQSETG
jgi:hypothetical protein